MQYRLFIYNVNSDTVYNLQYIDFFFSFWILQRLPVPPISCNGLRCQLWPTLVAALGSSALSSPAIFALRPLVVSRLATAILVVPWSWTTRSVLWLVSPPLALPWAVKLAGPVSSLASLPTWTGLRTTLVFIESNFILKHVAIMKNKIKTVF